MKTQCKPNQLEFERLGRKKVIADFSGGQISSDGGVLLLREIDTRLRISDRLANCFADYRNPKLIDHSVVELIKQRSYAIALGYEDLNDHQNLCRDPLLASAVGKTDVIGANRNSPKNQGIALASPSTLGRIERTKNGADKESRYDKVVCNFGKLREVFTQIFIERYQRRKPSQLVLDIDPSDIELHGSQEDCHYNGYYKHNCYLPNYLFCGEYPLAVKLRPSNIDGAKGVVDFIRPVIDQLRKQWPKVKILIRADSGFCREELMHYCESQKGIDYVFGMGRNSRLRPRLEELMREAESIYNNTGKVVRLYQSFGYRTLDSWSRARRIAGKAEFGPHGEDIRFVVTSLPDKKVKPKRLYEKIYCARGEMENRIKEQQLDLFGNRASCHSFRGNYLRLWWSMVAHLLIVKLREYALSNTELAKAQASSLRVKLFKIGALVEVSVRRVYIRLSSAYPLQTLFLQIHQRLRGPPDLAYVRA